MIIFVDVWRNLVCRVILATMISTSKSKTRTQPLAVLDARADKKNMLRKKLAFFKLHRKHIEHQNVNAQLQEVTRQGGTIVAELKTLEEKKACALRLSTLKSIEQQMAPMVQFNKNIEPFCRVQHWVGLSSADVARLKGLFLFVDIGQSCLTFHFTRVARRPKGIPGHRTNTGQDRATDAARQLDAGVCPSQKGGQGIVHEGGQGDLRYQSYVA